MILAFLMTSITAITLQECPGLTTEERLAKFTALAMMSLVLRAVSSEWEMAEDTSYH